MAKKGQLTKSDYIPMDEFKRVISLLNEDKRFKFELYFVFSCATALRVCDVMSTNWGDVVSRDGSVKSIFVKKELKTGKIRKISFSRSTSERITRLYSDLGCPDLNSPMFANKWGDKPWTTQYLNAELKRIRDKYDISIANFSTHTFRKTFARNYWESQKRSSGALILLMDVLNHSSIAMTKKYLGITDEEIAEVYSNLDF